MKQFFSNISDVHSLELVTQMDKLEKLGILNRAVSSEFPIQNFPVFFFFFFFFFFCFSGILFIFQIFSFELPIAEDIETLDLNLEKYFQSPKKCGQNYQHHFFHVTKSTYTFLENLLDDALWPIYCEMKIVIDKIKIFVCK